MGNAESSNVPGGGSEGYHVLRVQDNSPGQLAGLEAFFDFIVAVGNTRLDKDDESFKQTLSNSVDKPLELTVYNSKSQTVRQTQIIPSNSWGGQGILGISIRFCSFDGANQNVWHIISVQPKSPADLAGLQADSDYVLGAESVLQQADDLIALVQANIGKPVKLYVYNVDSDTVREVSLTPNDGWGGEGCLGCDIGYGYLHRIPTSVDRAPPSFVPPPQASAQTPAQHNISGFIAQPGFTGIPQLDNVHSGAPTTQPQVPHFPDPSEFAVPQPPISTPYQAPVSASDPYHPPSSSPYQQPAPTTSVPTVPAVSQQEVPSPYSYQPQTPLPPTFTPSVPANFSAPPSIPQVPQQAYSPTQYSAPPQVPNPFPVAPPASNYDFTAPPSSTPFVPTLPANSPIVTPSPVAGIEQSLNNMDINYNQHVHQPEVPISTSSYQPYLAYGVPASSVPQYQYPPQIPSVPTSYPPQQYQQPNYGPLPVSAPTAQAPPPVNFPMPPLSSLGISSLIPPVGGEQYTAPPTFNQPQY